MILVREHLQAAEQLGKVPGLTHIAARGWHHTNCPTGVQNENTPEAAGRVGECKPAARRGLGGHGCGVVRSSPKDD